METNPQSQASTEESLHSNENSQDSEVASKKSEESSKSPLPLPSSNLNLIQVDELDNETVKSLKGDAIGDTLYSERFVLKTLMELKEQNGKKIEDSFEKVCCCFIRELQ
jgi:hypothetical protein